jgi:hypothetical protein
MQGPQPYPQNPQYRQPQQQPYLNNANNFQQGFGVPAQPSQPQIKKIHPKRNNKKILIITSLSLVFLALSSVSGFLYLETQRLNKKVADTETQIIARANEQIISQKVQKNEIADIFDDQAALNDDLIDSQRQVAASSEEFMVFVSNSIRFISGKPQFFNEFTEEELVDKKNEVLQEIEEFKKLSEENSNKKEINSDRVNQIYLDAEEDRNNTANEREGFR